MKRLLFICMFCSMISLGSFGVLLAEDLRLGLALPYSVPLAFLATLIVVAILQLLATAIWPQRTVVLDEAVRDPAPVAEPVVAETPAAAEPARVPPPGARRTPQGVVLFDMSRVTARRPAA